MLFIHDHTFVIKNNKYYTTGSLNQIIMDRYKKWFKNVTVFANYREANIKDEQYIKDDNKVNGVEFKLVSKRNNIINLIKASKKIKEEVRKNDFIVIRMSIFGAIGAYYSKKLNKKYLIEMVACPWDSLWYHSFKGKLLAPFMTLLTKRICREAKYVVYVTNEFLQRRYPTKGISIGCSDVELENQNCNIQQKRIKRINELNNSNIKLCTIANIEVKYKGQDLIIKSLKKLKNSNIRFTYYLIGGGKPDRIKKIIHRNGLEDNVKIIGAIPHKEVFDWLDNIDIYVQPSYQEGLPRAVIEAMSRGCPIIGSSAGGIPELINSKCVFKKGKMNQFLRILKKMNKEEMQCYSKENFENSKKYEKEYLNKEREKFYFKFRNS